MSEKKFHFDGHDCVYSKNKDDERHVMTINLEAEIFCFMFIFIHDLNILFISIIQNALFL